jgi:hypothetical protein
MKPVRSKERGYRDTERTSSGLLAVSITNVSTSQVLSLLLWVATQPFSSLLLMYFFFLRQPPLPPTSFPLNAARERRDLLTLNCIYIYVCVLGVLSRNQAEKKRQCVCDKTMQRKLHLSFHALPRCGSGLVTQGSHVDAEDTRLLPGRSTPRCPPPLAAHTHVPQRGQASKRRWTAMSMCGTPLQPRRLVWRAAMLPHCRAHAQTKTTSMQHRDAPLQGPYA